MLKSKRVLVFLILCSIAIVVFNIIVVEEEDSTMKTTIISMNELLKVKQGDSYTFNLKIKDIEEVNNHVKINLSIENKGSKDANLNYVRFYLLGKTNNELATSILTPMSDAKLPDIIESNSTVEGDIYFNIPEEEYKKLKIIVPDYEKGNEEIEYIIKLNK